VAHLTEEIMKETAWHVLITELIAEAATDQVLRELHQVTNENHRNTFAGRLASNGLVDTAQETNTTVRSFLAAVHCFTLEPTVECEAASRDDIDRAPRAITTAHVVHHVITNSR